MRTKLFVLVGVALLVSTVSEAQIRRHLAPTCGNSYPVDLEAVSVGGIPDYQLLDLAYSPPMAGEPVTVHLSVKNNASCIMVSGFDVTLVNLNNYQQIASVHVTTPLRPTESISINVPFAMPQPSFAWQTMQIRYAVSSTVPDYDSSNDWSWFDIASWGGPHLVVSDFAVFECLVCSVGYCGKHQRVYVKVTNVGPHTYCNSDDPPIAFRTHVRTLGPGGEMDVGDPAYSPHVPDLEPGQSAWIEAAHLIEGSNPVLTGSAFKVAIEYAYVTGLVQYIPGDCGNRYTRDTVDYPYMTPAFKGISFYGESMCRYHLP